MGQEQTDAAPVGVGIEREVLSLMAEDRSNSGNAAALVITPGVVEKHVANIFAKLGG